jgi:hypothetical protein
MQGGRRDDLPPGMRRVAVERAVFRFIADASGGAVPDRIGAPAVFFGGRDHGRRTPARLARG